MIECAAMKTGILRRCCSPAVRASALHALSAFTGICKCMIGGFMAHKRYWINTLSGMDDREIGGKMTQMLSYLLLIRKFFYSLH